MTADHLAELTAKREALQAQADSLQATLDTIAEVEDAVATDGLTLEEMLALKTLVYNDLPDASSVSAELAKVQLSLSALDKVLAAHSPPPTATPGAVTTSG